MKAFIFCAGLGTRLKPLTNNKPKALIELKNKTLLEYAILHLIKYNINEFVINVHHYADLIIEKCKILEDKYNIKIQISNESQKLLETGGAIKKAKDLLYNEKFFITYNVDILSNLNIINLINFFRKKNCIATIVTRIRDTQRYFLFNENNILCGWENVKTGERLIKNNSFKNLKRLAFSGISVISTEIYEFLNHSDDVFSITNLFLDICNKRNITTYVDNDSFWYEVGTIEKYEKIKNSELNELQL